MTNSTIKIEYTDMDKQTSHEQLVKALKEVLTDEQPDGLVLVKRIPFICKDINDIKLNIKWIIWFVMGIAGGIGFLALKTIGG